MRDKTKQRYENATFRREKLIALAWLVLFAVMVGGSAYQGFQTLLQILPSQVFATR